MARSRDFVAFFVGGVGGCGKDAGCMTGDGPRFRCALFVCKFGR